MKYIYPIILIICICIFSSCEEENHEPYGNYGESPDPIVEASVENLPGAAKITYSLPGDKDILFVKAEYEPSPGKTRSIRSSFYKNEVYLEGFNKAGEYDVKLYTVDRGENASEPVIVTVSPLTPPIVTIYKSLNLIEDFGGANITFSNETSSSVAISVLVDDGTGDYTPTETYYTKEEQGSFSVRGFDPVERVFGVVIRDRWNNYSDTLFKTVTPIFEEQLDKELFSEIILPTDEVSAWGRPMHRLWDDIVDTGTSIFHTAQGSGIPQWFTFDMGTTAKLSRFKIWQRMNTALLYEHGNPKKWEFWGRADQPNPDGSWDGWIYLGTFDSYKPSGLPMGSYTNEDWEYANRGEEFNFPLDAPPVRYMRFKLLENWSGTDYLNFCELTFWGQVED